MNKQHQLDQNSPFETLAALVTATIILYLMFDQPWLLYLGIGLGIVGLIIKQVAVLLHKYWNKLIRAVGFVVSHVILTIIFFVFLTPISFLYKLANRKKLMYKNQDDSLFVDRDHQYEAKDLANPW